MRLTPSFSSAGPFRFFLARVFTKTPIPQFTGTPDRLRSHLLVCVPSLRSLPLPPAPSSPPKVHNDGSGQCGGSKPHHRHSPLASALPVRVVCLGRYTSNLTRYAPFLSCVSFTHAPRPATPPVPIISLQKTHDDSDGRYRGSELHQLSIRFQLQPPPITVAYQSLHLGRNLPKPSRALPCRFTRSNAYPFLPPIPIFCPYLPPPHYEGMNLRPCLHLNVRLTTGLTPK